MKAVIMAGGSGTRLRPLTCDIPKPMVPVLNKPVMEHIINLLKREGITEIAVTTHYLPQSIKDYFSDGKKWGVNLHYFHEKYPLGTAGSVQNASDFLDESFIVISGDAVCDFNLNKAISFHQEMEAEATLVLTKVNVPLDYGVVITDNKYRITSFMEKPGWGQVFSDTINTGIYILERDIFNYYKKGIKYDFSKDLFPLMLKADKKLYGLPLSGYWNDIGTIKDYYETNRDFIMGKIDLPIEEIKKKVKGIFLEDGVYVDPSAKLKAPLFIARGSKIEKGVEIASSVIGKNNLIKSNSSIKNTISWDNNVIGHKSQIRSSVLADGVKLEEDVAVYDRTVIGRMSRIAKHCAIKPGVKIWPEKTVDEGSEVDSSIIAPSRWQDSLFKEDLIKGKEGIDIRSAFITRIALALSSFLEESAEIALCSDGSKASRAYKLVLAGSLAASANSILDLGDLSKTAFKYSIDQLQNDCGVYISKDLFENEISLSFYDSRGITISEKYKKSIEKKYFTEKYRTRTAEIGEYSYLPGRYRDYLKNIEKEIKKNIIKEKYYTIVVSAKKKLLYPIRKLLKNMNCQLIEVDFSESDLKDSQKIICSNADLYVEFLNDGEDIRVYDNKKRIINKALFNMLLSKILIDRGEEKLFLPITYPRAIEDYARSKGKEVIYTRANKRAAHDHYYKEKTKKESNANGILFPYADGLFSLSLILEKMASKDEKLSTIIDSLPDIYYQRAEISCDWEEKGRVMRLLAEEAENKDELIDGVKFEHDDGWALVLPDGEKALFHIFVEGRDMESAESLSGYYLNKLKKIIKNP